MNVSSDLQHRQFTSDNISGIVPEAMNALIQANSGHALPYGSDPWVAELNREIQRVFDTQCSTFPVFNGTGANALALAAISRSHHSVMAHQSAHIAVDEVNAPGLMGGGLRIETIAGENGLISPSALRHRIGQARGIHSSKPGVLSLTQANELGLCYRPEQIAELSAIAREHDMAVHMDGARFANAVAALGVTPADITWRAGVDVLVLGGTKLGLPFGELVIFFNEALARDFEWKRKQAGQLASKMRFLAAPWLGVLKEDCWLHYAAQCNAKAQEIAVRAAAIPDIQLAVPQQTNAVFLQLNDAQQTAMFERGWILINLTEESGVRILCSWDITQRDIDAFISDLEQL